ncbi:MAG: nucleotidyltransferase family protein [Desulfurobacteriaceae bacterium]
MSNNVLEELRKVKPLLYEKYGVKEILLFGSFARSEGKENSDVDLLVEFKEGFETFRNYMNLKEFLEHLFQRPVDLVIKKSLKPFLKKKVEEEAIHV